MLQRKDEELLKKRLEDGARIDFADPLANSVKCWQLDTQQFVASFYEFSEGIIEGKIIFLLKMNPAEFL